MKVEYSPPSLKLEKEVTPLATDEVLPDKLEHPFPIVVIVEYLGNLEPKEEVTESLEVGKEEEESANKILVRMSLKMKNKRKINLRIITRRTSLKKIPSMKKKK